MALFPGFFPCPLGYFSVHAQRTVMVHNKPHVRCIIAQRPELMFTRCSLLLYYRSLSLTSLFVLCLCRLLSFFCFTLYSHAIAVCLATIVLDSCGKSGVAKAISSPPLDKIQTFTRGDVVLRKGRGSKKKVKSANVYIHTNIHMSSICKL